MSVIRRDRSDNFTIIPNEIYDEGRLSFEAKSLLIYLLTRPSNWKIHINQLKKVTGFGRDKCQNLTKELREVGYAKTVGIRGEKGQFLGSELVIYDCIIATPPEPENQALGDRDTGLPAPGQPVTGKSGPLIRTDSKTSTDSQNAQAREREDLDSDLEEKKHAREIAKEIEAGFWRVIKDWPKFAGMPKAKAQAEWNKLTDAERLEAAEKRDAWFALLKSQSKSHVAAPSTYFHEKLFREVTVPDAVDQPLRLKPYGKGWMAHRFWLLNLKRSKWYMTRFQQRMVDDGKAYIVTGDRHKGEFPLVAMMDADAEAGKDVVLRVGTNPPDIEGYTQVAQDTPEWQEWAAWHEANDLPWINSPEYIRFVWMPETIPEMLPAMETMNG